MKNFISIVLTVVAIISATAVCALSAAEFPKEKTETDYRGFRLSKVYPSRLNFSPIKREQSNEAAI